MIQPFEKCINFEVAKPVNLMAENKIVYLDIDKVIASRAKGKKIPKFVVNWVKRFIHQDWLNDYFKEGKLGVEFAEGALEHMNVKLNVIGEENIPSEGRFTFCGNHPLGGADALSMVAFLGRKYNGNIVSPANDFLMNVGQVQEFLVPVNKMGVQARELSSMLEEAFQSDKQLFIFPAGLCSRKIDGKITDLPWRKTFITKSRTSHRDVIPYWFSGKNSKRFYNLDILCKKLKIKLPLAMFCLPDELYRWRNRELTLVFGKPIPWESFTSDKKDIEWAEYVREKVYSLATE